jgi:TRAP transporter TAXI family solute receptor
MKRTHNWMVLLAAAAVMCLSAGAPAQAPDKSKWPTRLTFVTGPAGGFGFPTGSAWASAIGAEVGIPISVEATTGLQVNPLMIEEKKADVGLSAGDTSLESWNGADWTKGREIRAQRALVVLDPWVMQYYTTRASGITQLTDLNGKSVNPSRRRSWTDNVLRDMVAVLGLKPARISNVGPNDANSLLGDGRLDVAAVAGAIPHPAVSEFEVNHDMVMLSMTKDQQQKFLAKQKALVAYDIPANSYKGQTQPIATVASYNVYIISKDVPDSLAYALAKATFTKKDQLAAAHKSFGRLDVKNIVHATIPVHPGAVKFYEEQGIQLPARLKSAK